MKKKILFVDDEETFAKMMKIVLEESGEYEIKVETKGAKVVSTAKEFKPDLVLLDIIMPDLDGCEVLQRLQEEDSLKNIPVVFLTALVRENEVLSRNGIISGYPFIAKPVTIEKLTACINQNLIKK